jgi:hypothetical protein
MPATNSDEQVELKTTELTAAQRHDAMVRYSVLQPHLEEGIALKHAAHEATSSPTSG